MSIMLETKGLTKKYKHQTALNNVSIQVEKGSVYGLLGPNGAGKSTILKLITRMIPKSSGSIFFEGHELNTDDLLKIGAIIEAPAIYLNLTAYENLEVLTTLLNIDKSRINEVLKLVGLENNSKKIAKEFSLGMKQRLGIAMALLGDPKLLILDEPTNGLDPAGIMEIRKLITSLPKEKEMTVLISSHLLNEIEQMADYVGIINHGQMLYQGKLSNLESSGQSLEQIFLELTGEKESL